jgi:hypothetical protein
MKVEVFKRLIKEAVREAVREELAVVLSEDTIPTRTQVQQITQYERPRPTAPKPVYTGDPIMDMLNETRATMTREEYRDMASVTSDMAGPSMNPMQHFNAGPEPGLDISQFDFMMRAGDVYKASVAKDKERFGA